MPRHEDFEKIYQQMIEQYGEEKGKQVYYAWLKKMGYDDTKPMPKKESFSWIGSIKQIPGTSNFIRGQALHPIKTYHIDEWPEVREYLEEELEKSAHTLAGKPLLLDHYQVLRGKVLGAEYEDGAIEYVAQLNDPGVMELIKNGQIKHVSVEFEWKSLEQVNGLAPRGLNFTGLSLLRLFEPGDPQTTVELFESIVKQLKEAKNVHCSGHPAAPAGIQSVSPTPPIAQEGVMKMSKEKLKLKTLEGRVTYLETSKRLKEQELSKEEIEAKINELTKNRQALENELQQIAEEEQPRRDEIWQQIDLINAELQAYEQALAALVAGLTQPSAPTGSTEEGKGKEAEWDTEYINNLPDNAFAYIEPGGEKDEQGKTTPRSLRHLPFKNAQGNIDHDHLVNALARVKQAKTMPEGGKRAAIEKLCAAVRSWNRDHEDKIQSDVCDIHPEEAKEQQDQQEPEKDEHGCIIGKERWDPEQEKCVLIATEQQGNQEPEKDEHGCIIGKERYDQEQNKCVPITAEARIAFLETSLKLKEQELTEEEIKQKILDLTKQQEDLRNKLYPEAELSEEEKVAIQAQIDTLYAEIQAYEQALATKIAGQAAPPKETPAKPETPGEAIIPSGTPQPPVCVVPVEELEGIMPSLQAERSMSYGAQRLVQDVKRLIREAKEVPRNG